MKTACLHLLLALTLAQLPAQGLTPTQTMRLRYVSSVLDAGPHGVLFTRIEPRLAKDGVGPARRYLYQRTPEGEEKLLLRGGSSFQVQGDHVYFVARTPQTKTPQVLRRNLADGSVAAVTDFGPGVRSFKLSPDGKRLALISLSALSPLAQKAKAAGFKHRIHDEDYRQLQLHVWDLANNKSKALTQAAQGSVFAYYWAPDSKRLALALAPRNLVDDSYMFKRIHLVSLDGKLRKLVDNPGKLGEMAFSPDGSELAYISAADKRDPHAGMLYIANTKHGKVRAITPGLRGMVGHVHWDEEHGLHIGLARGVKTFLATVDPKTRKMRMRLGGQGVAFTDFEWHDDRLWLVGSSATHHRELFRGNPESGKAERLTDSNPWLKDVQLGRQEIVRFAARDGLQIEGILMYPLGYREGRRYPMVLVAHGGPEAHYDEGWNTGYSTWGQVLAGRGYFVWYPNYRSSTGYGVAFTKHDHGDLMGGEFNDHVDAIAHFAGRGLIDKQRVGIGGGSYGGYTAAWAATKGSAHFAAAVSFVPFVDIRTKWLTSDIPWEFHFVHYEEKPIPEQLGYLHDRSALTWADRCRTPLLLLGGTADPRVHPSQPHMLYRAVKFLTKTPVRYVQYPGEGHGNRTNVNQVDYLWRTLRWFDHYLKKPDRRMAPPPPYEIDYQDWLATGKAEGEDK